MKNKIDESISKYTGNLVYRKERDFFLYVFFLSWIILSFPSVVIHFCETRQVLLIPMVFFLVGIIGLLATIKKDQDRPALFEKGIVFYKKGQPIRLMAYSEVSFIRCVAPHNPNKGFIFYGIDFCNSKESYISVGSFSCKKLKKIWNQLLIHNPKLKQKLSAHDYHPSGNRLYLYNQLMESADYTV